MKKIIQWGVFALILTCGINVVLAQVMQTQPLSSILQKIKNEGYISVTRIQLLNDEYKVDALDNEGEPIEMVINAHNSETISTKKTDSHISMFEVVEKIEAVGYAGISLIERKNSHYEVTAIGPSGKKTRLNVDGFNGKIIEAN